MDDRESVIAEVFFNAGVFAATKFAALGYYGPGHILVEPFTDAALHSMKVDLGEEHAEVHFLPFSLHGHNVSVATHGFRALAPAQIAFVSFDIDELLDHVK